jgi:hypothetical protein
MVAIAQILVEGAFALLMAANLEVLKNNTQRKIKN